MTTFNSIWTSSLNQALQLQKNNSPLSIGGIQSASGSSGTGLMGPINVAKGQQGPLDILLSVVSKSVSDVMARDSFTQGMNFSNSFKSAFSLSPFQQTSMSMNNSIAAGSISTLTKGIFSQATSARSMSFQEKSSLMTTLLSGVNLGFLNSRSLLESQGLLTEMIHESLNNLQNNVQTNVGGFYDSVIGKSLNVYGDLTETDNNVVEIIPTDNSLVIANPKGNKISVNVDLIGSEEPTIYVESPEWFEMQGIETGLTKEEKADVEKLYTDHNALPRDSSLWDDFSSASMETPSSAAIESPAINISTSVKDNFGEFVEAPVFSVEETLVDQTVTGAESVQKIGTNVTENSEIAETMPEEQVQKNILEDELNKPVSDTVFASNDQNTNISLEGVFKEAYDILTNSDGFHLEESGTYKYKDISIVANLLFDKRLNPKMEISMVNLKDFETIKIDLKGNSLENEKLSSSGIAEIEFGDELVIEKDFRRGYNYSGEELKDIIKHSDDIRTYNFNGIEVKEYYGKMRTEDGYIKVKGAVETNGTLNPSWVAFTGIVNDNRYIKRETNTILKNDEGNIRIDKHVEFESIYMDPLALDMNGDGIQTVSAENGVEFDLLGTGQTVKTGWTVGGDDALLALDRNNSGAIESGKELFGNQHGAANGYEEIAKFDDNNDGVIDSQDKVYADLKLWNDANMNGVSEKGELRGLAEAGVASISTGFKNSSFVDAAGNEHRQVSSFTKTNGEKGVTTDLWFRYYGITSYINNQFLPSR